VASKEKRVAFWQVHVLDQAQRRTPVVDWRELMQGIAGLDMSELRHDDIVYDPHLTDDAVLLGVHEILNPAFMSQIDLAGKTITDLMDDHESTTESEQDAPPALANSTALCFLPVGNAVAVVTGSATSPRPPKVITDFLNAHAPQGKGAVWVAEAIMDRADITRFKEESQGVVRFEATINTVREVFRPDDSHGVARYADELADRTGGDVIVDIVVRLPPEARSRSVKARLGDLVRDDLERIVANPKSKAKVTALLPGGVEEELNLVASRLGATIEVDPKATESLRFSTLLDHLEEVSVEMEEKVRELLE
jgi:hypothetical protein